MDKEALLLFEQSQGIVAGISGGRDSMALLHMLKPFYPKLTVAHVNYQTRANSQAEEELVRQTCTALGLPCRVLRAEGCALDMPDFEAHARRVRYDFYIKTSLDAGADIIALAQHGGDLAETVLLRLMRGSSRLYMKKIRPLNETLTLVRPLLSWNREKITAYCAEHSLPWRDDESNESQYFLRNFLRHSILPALKARVPRLETRLALTARLREEEEDFLQAEASNAVRRLGEAPKCGDFLSLHPALRRRTLALWFEARGLPAPGARLAEEILRKLREARGGLVLHRQNGWDLILKGGRISWRRSPT